MRCQQRNSPTVPAPAPAPVPVLRKSCASLEQISALRCVIAQAMVVLGGPQAPASFGACAWPPSQLNVARHALMRHALVATAVVCTSFVNPAPLLAAGPVSSMDAGAATLDVRSVEAKGSPVARESLLRRQVFSRPDIQRRRPQNRAGAAAGARAADRAASPRGVGETRQVAGRRVLRVLTPTQAEKLGKYDVTGVGINLVIADSGAVKVGAVPPADSDAAKLGVTFGDVVLSINGRSTEGMTSFDALEAIQSDGSQVKLEFKPAAGGEARSVSLTKTFFEKNPVSYRVVRAEDGAHRVYQAERVQRAV